MVSLGLLFFSSDYILYLVLGIVLIPGILLAAVAQAKVSSTFHKYKQVTAASGVSARQMARAILDRAGLQHIQVIKVKGSLTDYYDHKGRQIALSEDVYDSASVASLGVAAHEVGHAIQYARNYLPTKIRAALVPVLNITSALMWPAVIIGLLLGLLSPSFAVGGFPIGMILMWCGVGFYGGSILFSLVTLPTEFDASRRANKILLESNILSPEEAVGAKKVLNAAAMTYVASLLMSILNLLRFLLYFFLRNRRNN